MDGELLTSAVDLISSIHGHQRRAERCIEKKDLQSAIKHGSKEEQQRELKSGLTVKRYKYTFADVVYITDEHSTKEITSWVLPLPLEKVLCSENDKNQYDKAKRRIANEPTIITSHSVFVVDCSGSMRKGDVVAHRCRLDSVRYSIATEFIAKRLHNPSIGVTPFDVVTIIEMRNEAEVVFEKEPTSWILYNKIVDRSKTDIPHSHGNYLPALKKAEEVLKDGDHEELALFLFFLTDGRPSDEYLSQRNIIEAGITNQTITRKAADIACQFKERLNFGMVGYGRPFEDMAVLERMAINMAAEGCIGKFQRSDLKKLDSLSTSIATMATTLTNTRTLLTTVRSSKRKEKVYTLTEFNKNLLKPGADWDTKTIEDHGLTRFEYARSGTGFIWKEKPLLNPTCFGISFNNKPFGNGAERLVYQLFEVDRHKRKVGGSLVAKESRFEVSFDYKKFHQTFCKTQKIADKMAQKFNGFLDRSPRIGGKVPRIKFLECFVYTFYNGNIEFNYLAEKEIDHAQYIKWNNNAGGVLGNKQKPVVFEESEAEEEEEPPPAKKKRVMFAEAEPTIDSDDEEDHHGGLEEVKPDSTNAGEEVDIMDEEVPQAFTHFTYTSTKRKRMVCDLQGVLDQKKRLFEFTDPAIHYESESGRKNVFGRTDKGRPGMLEFFKTHKCNKLCEALGISQNRLEEGN